MDDRDTPIEEQAVDRADTSAETGGVVEPKPRVRPDAPIDNGPSVIGRRYEVAELLGSGRRGTAYLTRDRLTDARVVVKRLRTDADHRAKTEMALRAAELAATVRHPEIARVFDIGEDAVGPYVVSEYIDGPDLTRVVTSGGAMTLSDSITVIGSVGEALLAAQDAGLYHGSVRGSNVVRAPEGGIKITDFGIAGLDETDVPKARRQDVRGLARTLCQLLTGVSQGTIDVHELPWSVRPVIRHAMGRSVAERASTIEVFLRELRATDLDADEHLDEAEAIKRGRQAELSGSFAAMREAGEQAQQANAESAEAMVLLRRADSLESEKAELLQAVSDAESAFDYASALQSLVSLGRKFPADHHVTRLVSQKRQQLAELTRLRGLGDQLVAAGRVADAVGAWERVLEMRPDDPGAQEQVRLGRQARTKRRVVSSLGGLIGLAAVSGTAVAVYEFTRPTGTVEQMAPVTEQPAQASAGDSRQAATNPLVRPDDLPGMNAGAATDAGVSSDETLSGGEGSARDEAAAEIDASRETARVERPAAPGLSLEAEARQADRDALSARGHAVAAGAAGLAPEQFGRAQQRYERGSSLLASGSLGEALEMLASARGDFVTAAGAARLRIAEIESLIGERRLRAAEAELNAVADVAPAAVVRELSEAMAAARGRVVRLTDGTEIALRYVEPGVFEMGSDADEPGRRATEDRRVTRIERPYWMMQTELTRGQWAAARGETPGPDASLPVTGLSLDSALEVASMLSAVADGTFSIPTEAQWEYAARADSEAIRGGHPTDDAAWWLGNSGAKLQPVGRILANSWGLYDMLGNAAELVIAPDLGHGKQVAMTRGGSYLSPEAAVRAAARHELVPRDAGDPRTGVRLIWSPSGEGGE